MCCILYLFPVFVLPQVAEEMQLSFGTDISAVDILGLSLHNNEWLNHGA